MGRDAAIPQDEASAWSLLTRDVRLGPDDLARIGLRPYLRAGEDTGLPRKYQIFEVVTASVFASLKPDYDWAVSPNRADGGVDFVGRGPFLRSEFLGIDASILIGGECKKRSSASALEALHASIIKMCETLRPTFVIGVVSAPLSAARVAASRSLLESQLKRHCHILDRRQIEGLIGQRLEILASVAERALDVAAAQAVLEYFTRKRGSHVAAQSDPSDIPAAMGWPICVPVRIRHASPGASVRMFWRPGDDAHAIRAIAPGGIDNRAGSQFRLGADVTHPFSEELQLEFVTHQVGRHELGMLEIVTENGESSACRLPAIDVAPDFRPAFYAPPYQAAMDEIAAAFARARAGRPVVVAVTGAGGGGKTRLCEEAGIEARRLGASYVAAEQANSDDRPYHLLANLLVALAPGPAIGEPLSQAPLDALERLQPDMVERARSSITSLVDRAGAAGGDDHVLLSAFVLLISARSRNLPLVIHLQNLHWCSVDALEFIERLIWQLSQISQAGSGVSGAKVPVRVLFLLEGRTHEQRYALDAGWSTRSFEACLERLDCAQLACRSFSGRESAEFAERLFEAPGSAARRVPDHLLRVQRMVAEAIVRASGGNPFHILEQVRLLRQQGVLAINPKTGLLFLVYPPAGALELPAAVAETIQARWRYWANDDPGMGRLVLAAAMFEDRLPSGLFGHLWRVLASSASRKDLEALELFRLPEADALSEYAFSHENYFHALHGQQTEERERRQILEAYLSWFLANRVGDPELIFIHARVALQHDPGDLAGAEALLREVIRLSNAQLKPALAARSMAALLDGVTWPRIRNGAASMPSLVAACDDEVALARQLITTGNRNVALDRLGRVLGHLANRPARRAGSAFEALERSSLMLSAMRVRALFNNGEPVRAAALAEELVADAEDLISPDDRDPERRKLLMEALHTHAVAAALSGDLGRALETSEQATRIAETLEERDDRALDVISTHGNIMITRDPAEAMRILESCGPRADRADASGRLRLRLEINMAMAEIVIAYELRQAEPDSAMARLRAVEGDLRSTCRRANAAGRHADAAAAALLRGIALTLLGEEARGQFAEAVAAASRAGQLETLWRAQINLAHSLSAAGSSPLESAAAALAILSSTLQSTEPAAFSPRFRLVALPMAQAARYCISAGDPRGAAALARFPALAALFDDPALGVLADARSVPQSREWLRVGDVDYILY